MTIMTKQTLVKSGTHDKRFIWPVIISKIATLIDEGKTDGTCHQVTTYAFANGSDYIEYQENRRPFVDEAAANEYIDFIRTVDAEYGMNMISGEVLDYDGTWPTTA